jgi:hypothetical protein
VIQIINLLIKQEAVALLTVSFRNARGKERGNQDGLDVNCDQHITELDVKR